jgi:hypothetical protein
MTTDGKGNFTAQPNTYSPLGNSWNQISRGNYGGIVFFQVDASVLLQFAKIDQNGNVTVQQSFNAATPVFPATAILTAGAFS